MSSSQKSLRSFVYTFCAVLTIFYFFFAGEGLKQTTFQEALSVLPNALFIGLCLGLFSGTSAILENKTEYFKDNILFSVPFCALYMPAMHLVSWSIWEYIRFLQT